MVLATLPQFRLFCEAVYTDKPLWRFVLEQVDGTHTLAASDVEPDAGGERLELLALVRGLEALWTPSRLTLVTPSRYVLYGLEHGLSEWSEQGWQWESFGQLVPIKNGDLWRRVARALSFHQLIERHIRIDGSHRRSWRSAGGVVPRPHFSRFAADQNALAEEAAVA